MIVLTASLFLAVGANPAVDRYGDPLPPGAVARLGTTRFYSDGVINHPIVLPGGRHAAFASASASEAAIVVMDLDSGKIVRRITRSVKDDNRAYPGTALALGPDGRTLAIGCRRDATDENTPMPVWLVDVTTGATRREVADPPHRHVVALAFLAAGRQLAGLDGYGVITVWDAASGAKMREFKAPDHRLVSLAATADGSMFAAGGEAKVGAAPVYVWDTATGNLRHTLTGHTVSVRAVAFAPDGRTLASGGNATVRLWDVAGGRELRQFHGHIRRYDPVPEWSKYMGGPFDPNHFIYSLAFSSDGRVVASKSTDGTVRVSATGTGQPVDDFPILDHHQVSLAFRDGRKLILGRGVEMIERDTAARVFTNDNLRWPAHLTFSADGRRVVGDDATHTWDAADGRLLAVKTWDWSKEYWRPPTLVAPGGGLVAFPQAEDRAPGTCIADATTGRVVCRLTDKGQRPVMFSAHGGRLATLLPAPPGPGASDVLTIWDAATGARINQFKVAQFMALSADGRAVFTAEDKPHRLRQWDVAGGRVVRDYPLPDDRSLKSFVVSAGGRRFATLCQNDKDAQLRVWDAATGRACWEANFPRQMFVGRDLAISPDGSWLATDHWNGRQFVIDVWDSGTGAQVAAIDSHAKDIFILAFSPDGRRLASTSLYEPTLIWDVEAASGRRAMNLLDPARQADMWAELAGGDGPGARAADCLQAAPAVAVTLLKANLRPAAAGAVPAERIATLVAGLDSASFRAREQAQRDLAALGPGAEPAVRAARKGANAEVGRRLDTALASWEGDQLRASRAVEVLEFVGSAEARALLAELAGGDPAARLTREAKVCLERLGAVR